MKIDKTLDKAVLYCYRELYANANPPASFDELLMNSTVNEKGNREIPHMKYEIEEAIFHEIIEDTMNIYKIKHKILKNNFVSTILDWYVPKIKYTRL